MNLPFWVNLLFWIATIIGGFLLVDFYRNDFIKMKKGNQ